MHEIHSSPDSTVRLQIGDVRHVLTRDEATALAIDLVDVLAGCEPSSFAVLMEDEEAAVDPDDFAALKASVSRVFSVIGNDEGQSLPTSLKAVCLSENDRLRAAS